MAERENWAEGNIPESDMYARLVRGEMYRIKFTKELREAQIEFDKPILAYELELEEAICLQYFSPVFSEY